MQNIDNNSKPDRKKKMPTKPEGSKKERIWYILDVLKRHSDDYNPLTIGKIKELIRKDHNIDLTAKIIGSYINLLNGIDDKVDYQKESVRIVDGEEQLVRSDWYYAHDLTAVEFNYMVDRLLFSKYIPPKQCEQIIKTFSELSSDRYKPRGKIPYNTTTDENYLLTALETVDHAKRIRRKIRFTFNGYGVDKKLSPVKKDDGTDQIFTVSPYEIAIKNERYYLICAFDANERYENKKLYHFRLDYMSNIEILDKEKARPISDVIGYGRELRLHDYMKGRIYMNTGDKVPVVFRIHPDLISSIVDWVGIDFTVTEKTDDYVSVRVNVVEEDMFYWALQYGLNVEILKPDDLRKRIRDATEKMWKKYK